MNEEEIYNEYNELPKEEYEKIRYSKWSPKAFVIGFGAGWIIGLIFTMSGGIRFAW